MLKNVIVMAKIRSSNAFFVLTSTSFNLLHIHIYETEIRQFGVVMTTIYRWTIILEYSIMNDSQAILKILLNANIY